MTSAICGFWSEKPKLPVRNRYSALLALPGVKRIAFTQIVGPLGAQMWLIVVILLVLDYFNSPALAGLMGLINYSGVLFVPVAGSLLEKHGNKRVILLDYLVSATAISVIALLVATHRLTIPLMIVLGLVVAMTSQFSLLGLRTALPSRIPDAMLDRVNALTFSTRGIARVFAPLLASLITAKFGSATAAFATAGVYVTAFFVIIGYEHSNFGSARPQNVLKVAFDGVRYTFSIPLLRNLLIFAAVFQLGWGAFYGSVPAFAKADMAASKSFIGMFYFVFAISNVTFGLLSGRFKTAGREWAICGAGALISGLAFLLVATGSNIGFFTAAFLLGASETPFDQATYGARQRAVSSEWLGRTTATCLMVDFGSFGSGVAFAGFIAGLSTTASLLVSTTILVLAFVLASTLIRSSQKSHIQAGD